MLKLTSANDGWEQPAVAPPQSDGSEIGPESPTFEAPEAPTLRQVLESMKVMPYNIAMQWFLQPLHWLVATAVYGLLSLRIYML